MTGPTLSPLVAAALAAVMRDAERHGVGVRLQPPAPLHGGAPGSAGAPTGDDEAAFWVWQDDGSGSGFYLDHDDEPGAACAARVADTVHDAAIDALWGEGRDTAWPPCPEHPRTHPLVVGVGDPAPTWTCPTSARVVCDVGELP